MECLVELESSISSENTVALVYIAGYMQMKAGSAIVDDTNFYCEKYGDFFANCKLRWSYSSFRSHSPVGDVMFRFFHELAWTYL